MATGKNSQPHKLMNGTSSNHPASSVSSANSYNPIAVINGEMNSEEGRRLLKKVDTMREILRTEKIPLPQIVVVGDQSAGKSSILESISGIELPRAQDICTRCPLELRMKHVSAEQPEYATIRCQGLNETTLHDLSQISNGVVQCTNYLAGDSANVSTLPILLTVYKHDIQDDLTLIDLPGITRTPVAGQSPTIYADIVSLIDKYVKSDTDIVLHVIQSSVDFTTSQSIQICQRHDPRFERQMIAVSKIDKHDPGIGEKLQGIGPKSLALPLGCVAVLNRTQEEINARVSFEEMRRREAEFFRTNSTFDNVPHEYLGSSELIKKLVAIQQDRIRYTLPSVIHNVRGKTRIMQDELRQIPPTLVTETDTRIAFNELLRNYRKAVEERAKGDYEIKAAGTPAKFDPRARDRWDDRIAYHLKMIGKCASEEIEKIFSGFSSKDLSKTMLRAIEENYGGGLPNFPSSNIIQQLYQPYHQQLAKPCRELVLWVEDYMTECLVYILAGILPAQVHYKEPLARELHKTIKGVIEHSREKCMHNVEQMLEMEEKVFTVNPHYLALFNQMKEKETQGTLPSDNVGPRDALLGLRAYCSIVHTRIVDHLSQLCEYWFIRKGVLILDAQLNTAFSPAQILKLMKEPPALEKRRTALRQSIAAMEAALAEAEK